MIAWVTDSTYPRGAFTVLAVVLSALSPAAAQHDSGVPAATKAPGPDRSLVLRLARNPDEAPDSEAKKACLAGHPPISCELLTVTLKNEGTKAILRWYTTCQEGMGFDVITGDGNWQQFPVTTSIMVCNRNMLVVRRLLPGQSDVRNLRLADPSLGLDTTAPPSDDDGFIHVRGKGYPLLMGHEPLTIRARWNNSVCIASDAIKSDSNLNLAEGHALCAGGTDPHPMVLTSEALQLR